jgi:hypothetical protein
LEGGGREGEGVRGERKGERSSEQGEEEGKEERGEEDPYDYLRTLQCWIFCEITVSGSERGKRGRTGEKREKYKKRSHSNIFFLFLFLLY